MVRIVLLGPPGVGKGTQAAAIARELGVPVVSTGDMFRRLATADTELGREVQEIMNSGGLVPDETTTRAVAARLEAPDVADGFVLDGFPRTGRQVADLDDVLAARGSAISRAFLFHADEDVLLARLVERGAQQGRADDEPHVVRTRLRTYAGTIWPVIEHYEDRHLLSRVDADRPRDEVTAHVLSVVTAGAGGGMLA